MVKVMLQQRSFNKALKMDTKPAVWVHLAWRYEQLIMDEENNQEDEKLPVWYKTKENFLIIFFLLLFLIGIFIRAIGGNIGTSTSLPKSLTSNNINHKNNVSKHTETTHNKFRQRTEKLVT